MRYKIIITCAEKRVAEEVYKLIQNSKIYNSTTKIINLNSIKEVCEECANK